MANGFTYPHCEVRDLEGLLWVHVALLSLAAILVVASFLSQFKEAAPYGRHYTAEKGKQWGPSINQRLGHFISDALPGVPFFLLVFLLYAGLLPRGDSFAEVKGVNIVLALGWLLHYLHRGWIHPFVMAYSSPTVPLGITLAGIFPNCLFAYLIASQIACTEYEDNWSRDPRFIIGVIIYCLGYITNRWADLSFRAMRLKRLRTGATQALTTDSASDGGDASPPNAAANSNEQAHGSHGDGPVPAEGSTKPSGGAPSKYFVPKGGLFDLISCPNYFGELVEWIGFAIACCSYPAIGWLLFSASTFIPRAFTHHAWYKRTFPDYPPNRKALIPFLL